MMTWQRMAASACLAVCMLTLGPVQPALAQSRTEHKFVSVAAATIYHFTRDPPIPQFPERARFARAIFIIPEMLRGSFFVGASTGSGVLLVRDRKHGTWSGPAFYTIGGASFGFQAGADAAMIVLLVMTDRGLNSFYRSSFKLGADASVATGTEGSGVGGATSPTLSSDILSFAKSQGGYLGISLDGTVVKLASKSNEAYYGRPVNLVDLLEKGEPRHPASAPLYEALDVLTH